MKHNDIKTTAEALSELEKSLLKIDEGNWGPWKLDRNTRQVYTEVKPATCSLPLSDLHGSRLIDSLRYLWEKGWADNECLGALVRAAFAIDWANADPLHGRSEKPAIENK